MASPLPSQSQTQPLTPPAEPSQNTTNSNTTNPQSTSTSANTSSQSSNPNPALPLTSSQDAGTSKRPRDARLIHLILASMGVSAYQERVPLQLLDFAYRYTSSVLQDALHLQAEGYDTADTGTGGKGRGRGAGAAAAKDNDPNAADPGGISLTSLRMAIASRSQHQFQQTLPKEFLLELASKRNAVGLPGSIRGGTRISDKNEGVSIGGVRLPHERYCLSGTGWSLKDSWDSEGEEEVEDGKVVNGFGGGDVGMEGTDDNPAGPTGDGEDMDMEEAAEREGLEDLFGGNNTKKEDEDHEMGDG